MCSNFQSLTRAQAIWVQKHFHLELPFEEWREEIYPTYPSPLIWLENNQLHCELAQFGLVPAWAANKPRFGTHTYNARSESISTKPSYRTAWKNRQFGLALMQAFYEPNYETGKPIRWRIKRTDAEPMAVATVWESYLNHDTGEIVRSFSMITVNATHHPVMHRFHGPEDEKRSIVILQDADYNAWLKADHQQAQALIKLAPDSFLTSEAAPRPRAKK